MESCRWQTNTLGLKIFKQEATMLALQMAGPPVGLPLKDHEEKNCISAGGRPQFLSLC